MTGNASELLGRTADDEKLLSAIQALNEKPIITHEEDEDIEYSMYYEFKQNGASLNFDRQKRVKCIFLYGNGYQGYSTSKLPLPQGLSFKMSRSEIRARLGQPEKSGGPCKEIVGKGSLVWDRWSFPSWNLHVQFPEAATCISLITLVASENPA